MERFVLWRVCAALVAVMLGAGCSGGSSPTPTPTGCTKDVDCAAGRICGTDGRCTDATSGTSETIPPPVSSGGASENPPPSRGGTGSSGSSSGGSKGCTSDGECPSVCVSGKCVDCKSDNDCRNNGECERQSLGGQCIGGASSCPYVTDEATCSANKCQCRSVYHNCGTETCYWKLK